MKETEDDTNKWKEILSSWIRRTNVAKMSITTQSNLQIQCNPYQNTNSVFCRTGTKNPKIFMEPQKILNSQSNIKKEKQSWRYHNFIFQVILQSCSNQNIMVLVQN